ncbi:MAG: hypothetical protein AAB391_01675 [Patescibacteria group bacterium]
MKHILASLLGVAKVAILMLVVGFGVTSLSAQSSWTPAPANPPANNASAPINISSLMQRKFGPLFLGTTAVLPSPPSPITSTFDVLGLASTTMLSTDTLLVSKAVTFVAGSPMKLLTFGSLGLTLADGTQGAGKVLTSNASGLASWQTLPAAPSTPSGTPANTAILGPLAYSAQDFGNNSANYVESTFTLAGPTDVVITSSVNVCGAIIFNVYMRVDGVEKDKKAFRGESNGADCGTVNLSSRVSLAAGSHTVKIQGGLFTSFPGYGNTTRPVDTFVYVLGGVSGGTTSSPAVVGSCDANPFQATNQSGPSMLSGTTYQNTSGTQLIVVATASETSFSGQNALAGYIGVSSASTLVSQEIFTSTNRNSITFLVPPGYYYKVVNGATNSPTLSSTAWKLCGGGSTTSGGGSVLKGVLTLASSRNVAPTGAYVSDSITVTGASVGDSVSVSLPNNYYNNYTPITAPLPCASIDASVVSPNMVKVRFSNAYDGTACAVPAGTYNVFVGSSAGVNTVTASAGVSQIIAGTGVTISPASGTGAVTVGMSPGQGMMGDVPDAILCQSASDTSKVIMYAQGVNTVSWGTPGRRIYSSDSDAGPHLTVYFHPTTGAWINDVVGLSQSYTNAINGCRDRNLSQQTGFKFAGVNNVTAAAPAAAAGTICGSATRKGTMTQFNTVSLATDSWGCAVDPTGANFNGPAESNDSQRRTVLNNGTCTGARKVVVDALERSFICVKQ